MAGELGQLIAGSTPQAAPAGAQIPILPQQTAPQSPVAATPSPPVDPLMAAGAVALQKFQQGVPLDPNDLNALVQIQSVVPPNDPTFDIIRQALGGEAAAGPSPEAAAVGAAAVGLGNSGIGQ